MKKILILTAALLTAMPAAAQVEGIAPALPLEDCRIRAGEGFPGIKARCGTFERLEDPSNPDSPTLALRVAVVPALSLEPEPDPFVPIAGGPGQSTVEFYASVYSAFEDVRRSRDIVLLDQRGTGESAPLRCEVDEDIIEGRYSREQTIEETAKCLEALPHDPRFFTTSVAVQDLEALRQALGYSQFNVYGISYGSRVAQHFLRRYPQSTRTVIIDGVAAPQIALGPAIAIESQNALDVVFGRCVEDAACNDRFPDLAARFDTLRNALAAEPVTVSMPDPLTGKLEDVQFSDVEMSGALRLLLYHSSTIALIPMLVNEATEGNLQPLAAQWQMVASNMSDAINLGMHNAVICTEDAPYFDRENIDLDQLEATYMGPLQVDALEAMCSIWPTGVLDADFKEPVTSDLPVLLLSGEADPITPPAYADLAAVDLGNALHLTGKRQGHGLAPRGCTPGIIGDFVETASVDGLDVDCLERLHAMPFFVDFSGPSP
ncbi:MAG: alpha/beta hydrolase [Gammaproteobacteria bacterium]|nr:alpha/beta hydrolase [Gammaproteobacteria bacterium]